jgi:hypothetical protein
MCYAVGRCRGQGVGWACARRRPGVMRGERLERLVPSLIGLVPACERKRLLLPCQKLRSAAWRCGSHLLCRYVRTRMCVHLHHTCLDAV